jgi:spermidine synthase
MAILWSKSVNGARYEVRTAGKTRRLYTDGVLHSQYHPERLFAGSIWDLLMLPALFYEPGCLQRILLLGVGGGAVIHLLRHYAQPRVIDAIDLNPVHLYVARRFFHVRPSQARLIEADGIAWLRNYRGPKYDMIIDDMYGEMDGEPSRAIELDHGWLSTLRRHLNPDGVMVLNTLSGRELRRAACFTHPALQRSFRSAFMLHDPVYHNAIGAVFRQPKDSREFRQRLRQYPALNHVNMRCRRLK